MKKYVIYIGILVIGVFLGSLFFGKSSTNQPLDKHEKTAETKQMWTCSMHPQIMKSKLGKCPICGMDLIPAETNTTSLSANQFKMTKNAMALADVETSIVGATKFEDNATTLSGKIVENEEANLVQISYFLGRIEKLNVNFKGEKVRKGQLLATIYSPKLVAAQQELITAASLKKSEPALYKAVRNKLKLWKLSEKQINQIETSKKIREIFPVYVTVSGTVSQKLVEQGDYIKQGQSLLKISNLNTVWASFDVYENQINLFKKGQAILISTRAYPNKKISAKVSFINPVLNAKTRTVKLRVLLNNKKEELKPGMFVRGKISGIKKDANQSIIIPTSAVLWTGNRSIVYLKVNPNRSVFEMREITTGSTLGNGVEVTSGLKNGDEIVTNGTFTVDAASQLQGKKSMMNQDKYEILTNSFNN